METWDQKRARFEHRCNQCQKAIELHEAYTRHQIILIKSAQITYLHSRCVDAYKVRIGRTT